MTVGGGASPMTFRDLVLADLRRGQRLIAKVDPDPIDPQFRIASGEDGDWWIAMTLPDDERQRQRRLALVKDFMIWKLAPAFILVTELHEPDCVMAVGVSHRERHACLSIIRRQPALAFGEPEWLDESSIGDDISSLLPRGATTLSADRMRILADWFGPGGKSPAVRIVTGEVGA